MIICYGRRINSPLELEVDKLFDVKYLNITDHIGIRSMIKVLTHISKTKPDIIHAHLGGITFALPWAIIHRKPLIVTLHTTAEKAFSIKNEKMIRRYIDKTNIKLVAVSKENQLAIQKYFRVDKSKCLCVNNGIDIERFYHNKTKKFTFLNVGRQDDNKNQQVIIKCFANLVKMNYDIQLILVGDGPNHENLRNQVINLGLEKEILFTGMVEDPFDYYINANCYIQSSHREAMPLSVLEAMASSLPIISTNVGGLKDVVDNSNGFLIDDNNEDVLFASMKKMLEMDETIEIDMVLILEKKLNNILRKKWL